MRRERMEEGPKLQWFTAIALANPELLESP